MPVNEITQVLCQAQMSSTEPSTAPELVQEERGFLVREERKKKKKKKGSSEVLTEPSVQIRHCFCLILPFLLPTRLPVKCVKVC